MTKLGTGAPRAVGFRSLEALIYPSGSSLVYSAASAVLCFGAFLYYRSKAVAGRSSS